MHVIIGHIKSTHWSFWRRRRLCSVLVEPSVCMVSLLPAVVRGRGRCGEVEVWGEVELWGEGMWWERREGDLVERCIKQCYTWSSPFSLYSFSQLSSHPLITITIKPLAQVTSYLSNHHWLPYFDPLSPLKPISTLQTIYPQATIDLLSHHRPTHLKSHSNWQLQLRSIHCPSVNYRRLLPLLLKKFSSFIWIIILFIIH